VLYERKDKWLQQKQRREKQIIEQTWVLPDFGFASGANKINNAVLIKVFGPFKFKNGEGAIWRGREKKITAQ
jgi:hypothetical protein